MTIHWNVNDELKYLIYDALEVKAGGGVSGRVADAVLYSIEESGDTGSIFSATTDNAADAIASQNQVSGRLAHFYRRRCFNHWIALLVELLISLLEPQTEKVKELSQLIRNSKEKAAFFLKECKENSLDITTPPGTFSSVKWGSYFDFIRHALNARSILNKCVIRFKEDLKHLKLHDDEWAKMIEIRNFLTPFNTFRYLFMRQYFCIFVFHLCFSFFKGCYWSHPLHRLVNW